MERGARYKYSHYSYFISNKDNKSEFSVHSVPVGKKIIYLQKLHVK